MDNKEKFLMMITSDPQYIWLPEHDDKKEIKGKKSKGEKLAQHYITTIKVVSGNMHMPFPRAIIINGDLVSFNNCGLRRDLQGFKKNFYVPYQEYFGKTSVFLGLGNHDYINNDGNTLLNSGALAMLDFVLDETRKMPNASSIDVVDDSHKLYTNHKGSLSYYIYFCGCVFIQLHEGPGFNSRISGEFETLYNITKSTEWLKEQLIKLADKDKVHSIFINLHEVSDNYDNTAILENILNFDYGKKVKAIFSGHFHKDYGRRSDIGDIPHFNSGSASQGTFISLVGDDQTREFELSVWKNEDIMNRCDAIIRNGPYKLFYDKQDIVLQTGKLKLVTVNKRDESERIADAKFEIRRADNNSLVNSVTTGKDGTVDNISLIVGDYYAIEVKCPEKFNLDNMHKYFKIEYEKETELTFYNEPKTLA